MEPNVTKHGYDINESKLSWHQSLICPVNTNF